MRRLFSKRSIAVGILASLLLLVATALLWSYPTGPWPSKTIRVFDNHTRSHQKIVAATQSWNSANVGIQFTIVHRQADADVVVSSFRDPDKMAQLCRPLQSILPIPSEQNLAACVDWQGWKPLRRVRLGIRDGQTSTVDISHELGHVLGLSHESSGCTIMRPTEATDGFCAGQQLTSSLQISFQQGCPQRQRAVMLLHCGFAIYDVALCGPGSDDIRRAQDMYDGPGNRQYNPFCVSAPPETRYPHGLKNTFAEGQQDSLRWQRRIVRWANQGKYTLPEACSSFRPSHDDQYAVGATYETLPAVKDACGGPAIYLIPSQWVHMPLGPPLS